MNWLIRLVILISIAVILVRIIKKNRKKQSESISKTPPKKHVAPKQKPHQEQVVPKQKEETWKYTPDHFSKSSINSVNSLLSKELDSYVKNKDTESLPSELKPFVEFPNAMMPQAAGIQDFISSPIPGEIQYKNFSAVSDEKTFSIQTSSKEIYFYKGAMVLVDNPYYVILPYAKINFTKATNKLEKLLKFSLDIKAISFFQYRPAFDSEQTVDFIMECVSFIKDQRSTDYTADDIVKILSEKEAKRVEKEKRDREKAEEARQIEDQRENELLELRDKSDVCRNAYNWVVKNRAALRELWNFTPATFGVLPKAGENAIDYSIRVNRAQMRDLKKQTSYMGERDQIIHNARYFMGRTNDKDAKRIYEIFLEENA